MSEQTQIPPDQYLVYDMNARQGPRRHDMTDGAFYELHASKGTPVPERHALLFLRDGAFRVIDATGKELASVAHLANERDGSRELAKDETIARYAELTHEALLARAVLRPGATGLSRKTPKDDLVAFLTDAPTKLELPRHLRARDTSTPEGLGDESGVTAGETGADVAAGVLGVAGRSPAEIASASLSFSG